MRVLYIHQYFRSPNDGGAIRSYYLAKSLVNNGFKVDLITSHNHKNLRIENIEGINVHFLPIKYDNRLTYLNRIISFIRFAISAFLYSYKLPKPNYVYASSTPLTVGITALCLKFFRRYKYFFEVRDLWPEAPIQMGIVKNKILKKLLYKLEFLTYKYADKIIALSPGMAEGVNRYQLKKSVEILPNISDCEYFQLEKKDLKNEFYFGVGEKMVVSYIGAIGKVNNLDSFLEVALECMKLDLKNITFLVAGKGSELKRLKQEAERLSLTNVRFLGFLNRIELKKLLNITDFSFISFADFKILETNSPNKFFDSIAAGKVCIVNNNGWIKDLIEENEIGFHYPKEFPSIFIQKMKFYLESDSEIIIQKRKARMLAETTFSRKIAEEKFVNLFVNQSKYKKSEYSSESISRAYN